MPGVLDYRLQVSPRFQPSQLYGLSGPGELSCNIFDIFSRLPHTTNLDIVFSQGTLLHMLFCVGV